MKVGENQKALLEFLRENDGKPLFLQKLVGVIGASESAPWQAAKALETHGLVKRGKIRDENGNLLMAVWSVRKVNSSVDGEMKALPSPEKPAEPERKIKVVRRKVEDLRMDEVRKIARKLGKLGVSSVNIETGEIVIRKTVKL